MKGEVGMSTILLTGATGVVGSGLLPLLLERGHKLICLTRPSHDKTAFDRVYDVVGSGIENVTVWSGDVTLPNLGVSDFELERWSGRIEKVIHCAASVKFDDALAEMTTAINVGGTQNTLALAEKLGIAEFHHVSTAYIAGDASFFRETDFDIGQGLRNVYEVTKKEAEKHVRAWRNGRYSVYRLGIVVGDSVTGYIPSFDGYYGFLGSLWWLKQALAEKAELEMARYASEGIAFDTDGMLILPICINCAPDSTLNLVPRDWVAEMLAALAEVPASGQAFHLVDPNPPQVQWVNGMSLHNLGINGYRYGERVDDRDSSLLGRFQRIVYRSTRMYIPYTTHEAVFDVRNAARILGNMCIPFPDIDDLFIARLLNYAKDANFGKEERKMVGVAA